MPRKLSYLPRIDSQFTHFAPTQFQWDEPHDPETLALLSAFRRAHGALRGPTTVVNRHTAIDIHRSSFEGRVK
jgi:hypothetical protein